MVVGFGIIELWIGESRSLKEKRGILSRVIKRVQNTFNVSIAEVGDNDHWKRAQVGFGLVGNDHAYINGKLEHLLHFIDELYLVEVVNTKLEILSLTEPLSRGDYEGKYDELHES